MSDNIEQNMEPTNKKEEGTNPNKPQVDLPYDINMSLFDNMISTLARSGAKGENIGELYKTLNVIAPIASKTTYLLRYMGLADSNNTKIWLTSEGQVFANSSLDNRRQVIMKNLPRNYKIMLGWIANSKDSSLSTGEIKSSVIRIFNFGLSQRLLDAVVVAFGNFFSHFGIIDYLKGKASRCTITETGKSLLTGNYSVAHTPNHQHMPSPSYLPTGASLPYQNSVNTESLAGEFPIMIITKGVKPLDWDIHHEEDWEHVDTYIRSLKNRWKNQQAHKRKPDGTPEASGENGR